MSGLVKYIALNNKNHKLHFSLQLNCVLNFKSITPYLKSLYKLSWTINVHITYYTSEKRGEDMRINYELIKELCQMQVTAREQIMTTKLKNPTNPDTDELDVFIDKLEDMFTSKSKKADFEELKGDLEYIKEYVEEKSWSDVTRWLTNIDSSLREFWSNYMDALKEKDTDNTSQE